MGERLASAFSPFDVLVITLAGGVAIAGIWWGIDGVPRESPSTAAVIGLVAGSYAAGHLVGAVSGLIWRRERDPMKHPWTRAFAGALGEGDAEPLSETDERLRRVFCDLRELPVLDQVELIRSALRQRKLDLRFETMNTVAWLSRSLATATGLLAAFFVVVALAKGDAGRLLPAAIGMGLAAVAFETRTRSYQYSSTRVLKFEALALADPPQALRDAIASATSASAAGTSATASTDVDETTR